MANNLHDRLFKEYSDKSPAARLAALRISMLSKIYQINSSSSLLLDKPVDENLGSTDIQFLLNNIKQESSDLKEILDALTLGH